MTEHRVVWMYRDFTTGRYFPAIEGRSEEDLRRVAREKYGRDYFGEYVVPAKVMVEVTTNIRLASDIHVERKHEA